jgi:hypothetical protein
MSIIKNKKKHQGDGRSSTNPRWSDYGKSPATIMQSDSSKYLDIQSLGKDSKDNSSQGDRSIGSGGASPIKGFGKKRKDGSPTTSQRSQFSMNRKKVEFLNQNT